MVLRLCVSSLSLIIKDTIWLGNSPNLLNWIVVNFIQQPLPEGSTTGAAGSTQAGALGKGQRASTGLTTCMYPIYLRRLETTAHYSSQYLLVLRDSHCGRVDC